MALKILMVEGMRYSAPTELFAFIFSSFLSSIIVIIICLLSLFTIWCTLGYVILDVEYLKSANQECVEV